MPPGIEQVYLVYPVSAFKSRTTGEKLPVRPVPSARRYRLLLCIVAVRQRMRAIKSTRWGRTPRGARKPPSVRTHLGSCNQRAGLNPHLPVPPIRNRLDPWADFFPALGWRFGIVDVASNTLK